MTLAPPPPSKRPPPPKLNGVRALLAMSWSALKFLLTPFVIFFIALQFATPSLSFDAKSSARTYKQAMEPTWQSVTSQSGQVWQTQQVKIITRDYRTIVADFIRPQGGDSSPQPLTIAIANFVPVEWLLDRVKPQGNQAFLVYRSPRAVGMMQQNWNALERLQTASKLSHYWAILTSNPVSQLYNVYMGLHEAPEDVVDIVNWAIENIHSDIGRINLIGLGSGSLVAAAAANKLNAIGLPARTLTLVYPPADLASATRDNLIHYPHWSRPLLAALLEPLYFRLSLERHLTRIYPTNKLIIIPRKSFDLATYAAEQATVWAGEHATIEYVDVNYTGFYDPINGNRVRELVGKWLFEQSAITSY
jgi:hypothetical protein